MHDWRSMSHVRWECKYHVVFIPKYRRKVLYGKLRQQIGAILRELCRQKGVELLEGHLMADHVHMCVSIPPKYSVAHTIGFLKGKSAVRIHRHLLKTQRVTGQSVRVGGAELGRATEPMQTATRPGAVPTSPSGATISTGPTSTRSGLPTWTAGRPLTTTGNRRSM